ncbi:hypothetical protein Scep_024522 [Stephania cephalantha]|uniref:Uncharacterized protein n=1 Tax=Stephania cephalantha TaxID=152367 RepID=A0AAP0EZL1_9MAGN
MDMVPLQVHRSIDSSLPTVAPLIAHRHELLIATGFSLYVTLHWTWRDLRPILIIFLP